MTAPTVATRTLVLRCPDCVRPIQVRIDQVDITPDGAPIFDPGPAAVALVLHRRGCIG